ncbi:MAG: radical SAM protein [Desulfobacterales bacterium]|nr:radical SAM protein [Desulfobacterales bacterium]
MIQVNFIHADKQVQLPLADLTQAAVEFLDIYGHAQFCGTAFARIIGTGAGRNKWSALLKACGFDQDPMAFFQAMAQSLGENPGRGIVLNGVTLPSPFIVALLQIILPGNGYVSIKDTDQLARAANLPIPDQDKTALQEVIEKYPVRLSRHTIRQMMVSRDVAYQYLPFVEELESVGHTNTWIGQFHDGLLEQMYQNRVIFLLNMSCPVYCRFCFRKHKDARNEANPTPEDVARAVDHVAASPRIKEIVITGGDPFMNRANMAAAIDGLMAVDHVETLRLATRSIAYYPDLFLADQGKYLKYLKEKNMALQQRGKGMEVATHFIHPDEVSPESLEIISDLVSSGIPVYIQTPFLSDCNDTGPELVRLFSLLKGAGAELHYIYIPCSPIHGNSIYWKPLSQGIDMAQHLRAHLSDRAIPRICTATPIGKMDWGSSGWAVEKVADNPNFIWIRTPYTPDYFKAFAPLANELTNIRINEEGTIDIQYMAKIGTPDYLWGKRPPRRSAQNPAASAQEISRLQDQLAVQTMPSIVPTGLEKLDRLHATRVRLSWEAGEAELDYVRTRAEITDVILSGDQDIHEQIYNLERLVKALGEIPHVNLVRLSSPAFMQRPQVYTRPIIQVLAKLNTLSVVLPQRLEIETWALTADEITHAHKKLTQQLNNRGITVYANVPLLGGVNDSPGAIHALAHALRRAGIEFHHLYVAGTPIQNQWNPQFPVDSYDVTDIATQVRREGSGREIPRYILATPLGEADYGLTATFTPPQEDIASVRLDCYPLGYFTALDPSFSFPEGVESDGAGCPVVKVPGLLKTNDFPVS